MSVAASASDSAAPAGGGGCLDELLDNERTNFRLLYDAVGELGAVPAMLRSVDMSATIPDEKVNVFSVSVCDQMIHKRCEMQLKIVSMH